MQSDRKVPPFPTHYLHLSSGCTRKRTTGAYETTRHHIPEDPNIFVRTLDFILTVTAGYTCILLAPTKWLASLSEPLVLSTGWLCVTAKKTCSNHVTTLSCSFLCGAMSCHMGLRAQVKLNISDCLSLVTLPLAPEVLSLELYKEMTK